MTVFAKISPKPSMTPFTNGKKRLMDSDESNAKKRERTGSVSSNTARVVDAAVTGRVVGAAPGGATWGWGCSGEWGREGSGNDRDGNEDATEDGTFSQCGESVGSVPAVPAAAEGAERDWWVPEVVVDPGTFDYIMQRGNDKKLKAEIINVTEGGGGTYLWVVGLTLSLRR
jgi:hypothetical protein